MSEVSFSPGQRWISDTEAELGLGIVLEVANRRVTLTFPAAGERRIYAIDNAPVSRVCYREGERVSGVDGEKLLIDRIEEEEGCLIYIGEDENGQPLSLMEMDLDSFVQFSTPKDRLFSGQVDKMQRFMLRCETLSHMRQHQQSTVNGLLGARVQLLPHQLYIAHETAGRYAPRVLLADEVGLGKTIEAGLVLHQQLISGRAQRALIVVPDSLVHQWLVEMLRRFNLHFTILDEERCEALAGEELDDPFAEDSLSDDPFAEEVLDEGAGTFGSENPFESAQLVLCSLSFLVNNPERHLQAQEAEWDLLLVDEAHHLAWSEQEVSPAYRCIEALAGVARGLLLLTATPEQLGIESHFARLRLLDPDRYYDLQQFKDEEASYEPVNALVQDLLALNDEEAGADIDIDALFARLQEFLGTETADSIRSTFDAGEVHQAVESATEALLDRHGTGRVLFRNTRANVEGFPERQLFTYPLPLPEGYAQLAAEVQMPNGLYPERVIESAVDSNWLEQDARVAWLMDWLREHRGEKVLLICAKADTALALEDHLNQRGGFSSSVFHEGLSLVARDRAAAYFADPEEGAQILVCSEIGSEGRNFQFSHNLVLFDLPLNPDLLEQRIGRLDRIGQRHTVKLHVPYYEDSVQAVLLRWFNEGLNCFEAASATGQAIFERFSGQLYDCLESSGDHDKLEVLINDTKEVNAELLLRLQEGRDRLLELNSCNEEAADKVVEAVFEDERRHELTSYMERIFDQFGVDQDRHSATSVVLHPGDHMLTPHFPGLPESGLTATYQREMALSREDVHFLSWEHPMVTGAMDLVLSGDFGNTSFCSIKLPPLKPGTLLLEAIYVVACPAPRSLQLFRYLPLTTIRILVDVKQTNLSGILSGEKLDELVQKVPRSSARELVKHARTEIEKMIDGAENLAAPQHQAIVAEATEKMLGQQRDELQRMQALAKVNPNIRKEEIESLRLETESLDQYLQSAQLKLDGVRVVIAT